MLLLLYMLKQNVDDVNASYARSQLPLFFAQKLSCEMCQDMLGCIRIWVCKTTLQNGLGRTDTGVHSTQHLRNGPGRRSFND